MKLWIAGLMACSISALSFAQSPVVIPSLGPQTVIGAVSSIANPDVLAGTATSLLSADLAAEANNTVTAASNSLSSTLSNGDVEQGLAGTSRQIESLLSVTK